MLAGKNQWFMIFSSISESDSATTTFSGKLINLYLIINEFGFN
jgi:hypothetical protein